MSVLSLKSLHKHTFTLEIVDLYKVVSLALSKCSYDAILPKSVKTSFCKISFGNVTIELPRSVLSILKLKLRKFMRSNIINSISKENSISLKEALTIFDSILSTVSNTKCFALKEELIKMTGFTKFLNINILNCIVLFENK